ncbi:MAG: LLM class flavin-dependent oxidoreductase [Chloroflexi bacterium]|nr:LLM class flavin-dependent oxidoreductase [Chloroflexota bacterium]
MQVRFAANVRPPENLAEVCAWARAAEDAGLEMLGVADSPSLYHDVYLTLALCALHSRRVRLGPAVTNPLTRHPVVAAGAITGIDYLSGGRAFLGIGTGHSAALNLSMPAASLAQFRAYVEAVRACLAGKPVDYDGRRTLFTLRSRPLPIYVGATGPKTMRLAGQIADGVIIRTVLLPPVIRFCLEQVHAGAREVGRDPASIDVWFMVSVSVAPTHAEAIDEIKATCVSAAHSVFARRIDPLMAPSDILPQVQEMLRRYAPADHTKQAGRENQNARIFDDLGIGDYLLKAFSLAGTPQECVQRARALATAGATQLFMGLHTKDKLRTLRLLAREVFPQLPVATL